MTEPEHGTPEWYDNAIANHQTALNAAQIQVIQHQTVIAIFTEERALAVARLKAIEAADDEDVFETVEKMRSKRQSTAKGLNHVGEHQLSGDSVR